MKYKTCMVLEPTAGFETRKLKDLVKRLKETCGVKYVDLSMGVIGVIGKDSKGLQDSLINMGMPTNESTYLLKRIIK